VVGKPTLPTDRKPEPSSKPGKSSAAKKSGSQKSGDKKGSKNKGKTKSKAGTEEEEQNDADEENKEEAEEQPHGEEERPREEYEDGEEEGEEEDDGSGEFDELSKMHVPQNMKKYVKYDSQKPSDQQDDSHANSQKTESQSIKKQISIKTLRNKENLHDQPADRNNLKRKTFSKKAMDETPSISKSELKKVKIKPFPKPKVIDNKPSTEKPKSKDLTVIKEEEPKPPKEDSFFKNFDASKLDFSKYKESQQSWNKDNKIKEKKDKKVLIPEEGPTFILEEVSEKPYSLGI
jgi:hypothetical protein